MSPEEKERLRQALLQVVLHDTAEQLRIHRAAAALGFGLNPCDYAHPFQPTTVNIFPPPAGPAPPAVAPRAHPWLHCLLVLATAAGLGGGAAALYSLWQGCKPIDLDVKWKLNDQGKWDADVKRVP